MSDTTGELFEFDNTFVAALPGLVVDWQPAAVPAPELVAFNRGLAAELGLDAEALASDAGVAVLAGNAVPAGSAPVAMVYAGHQFGGYSPRLGDGRALLLGEIVDPQGRRFDIHLKGSGRTPLARGGDGKAVLGPMLREFLIAEAMHALGVPTTRALAVATTGEQVAREQMLPGAVLTRIAASHLRVGTFEYAARAGDPDGFARLFDYSVARHYPHVGGADNPALAFLEAVADQQARLIAQWMLVGFIHGVMNTDNMTISGEGIDYGPCAFMDQYHPATVFSSIDHGGRYAYANQPAIATWNLARLAETLVSMVDDDFDVAAEALTAVLNGFRERYLSYWKQGMRAKLGLASDPAGAHDGESRGDGDDEVLFEGLLKLLEANRVDYTNTFRALAASLRGDRAAFNSSFAGGDLVAAVEWHDTWLSRVGTARDLAEVADAMDAVNPRYVPRNHLVEEALASANAGDLTLFEQLLGVVTDPFTERDGLDRYAEPAPDAFQEQFQTFCGT